MKKKILVLLLVVLALTFVAQVLVTTQPQQAMAKNMPLSGDCFLMCADYVMPCPDGGCGDDSHLQNQCKRWVVVCIKPKPPAK